MRKTGRKFLSLLLALVLALSLVSTAFADESTTTRGSASKDQKARTEMYVVTQTPGSDYPVYGAKNEPNGGVYYGRYAKGGNMSGGGYGLVNMNHMANESISAWYYQLGDSYGLEYWSYIYGPTIQSGNRAFLVSLNFVNEGSDCPSVNSGAYDSQLTKDFQYLNTLSCPVFVRIGAEVNLWGNRPAQADYIAAFQRISNLIHTNAPKAAVVFSAGYASENNLDMDSYYPGDAYVDWVGCSLYYNAASHVTNYKNDKFFGVGEVYGDPLLNVQQTVNLSKLHNKPVILTEGGSFCSLGGTDYSAFASDRLDRALSFLPMVYPQIKAIVTSNYDAPGGREGNFDFESNSTANAGYQHGAANNPTLRKSLQDTPSYYTKASAYTGAWDGMMTFAAYTYASTKQVAYWAVDGAGKYTATEYPYTFKLDVSALTPGSHTLTVTFGNGQTKSQKFTVGGSNAVTVPSGTGTPAVTPPAAAANNAQPTSDKLYVDGALQNPTVYKIDGSNYFKLRDVAIMLNGSAKQFEVGFDSASGAVQVTTGMAYTPNGSELTGAASSGKNAVISSNTIYINGAPASGLTVYQIDGNNYFKLRDLGQALDFFVGYDPATGVLVSGNSSYQN